MTYFFNAVVFPESGTRIIFHRIGNGDKLNILSEERVLERKDKSHLILKPMGNWFFFASR